MKRSKKKHQRLLQTIPDRTIHNGCKAIVQVYQSPPNHRNYWHQTRTFGLESIFTDTRRNTYRQTRLHSKQGRFSSSVWPIRYQRSYWSDGAIMHAGRWGCKVKVETHIEWTCILHELHMWMCRTRLMRFRTYERIYLSLTFGSDLSAQLWTCDSAVAWMVYENKIYCCDIRMCLLSSS